MKTYFAKFTTVLLLLMAGGLGPVVHASAASGAVAAISVNSTLDIPDAKPGDGICETGKGNKICTLRAAVMEANALPGKNIVKLQAATYFLTRVNTAGAPGADGALDITGPLTIKGKGADKTFLDGSNGAILDRVINITNVKVKLIGITIQNNHEGGRIAGAGISNQGNLVLKNSAVRNNTATLGGGIINFHTLRIFNSTISDNHSNTNSGGIYNGNGGTTTLTNSTVSGNAADQAGGGIFVQGGTVNLRSVTVVVNQSDYDSDDTGLDTGGGLYIEGGIVNVRNTLIADNFRAGFSFGDDCSGHLNSEDYNLVQFPSGCNITGITTHNKIGPANLGPLQLNGGTTETNALLPGSPAIDAGDPNGCVDQVGKLLKQDQRGFKRTANARCDIGAFESNSTP